MLDLKFIRENVNIVKEAVLSKNESADIDKIIQLDEERRKFISEVERLKYERNENSKKVAELKKSGQDASAIINRTKEISQTIKDLDAKLSETETILNHELIRVPNIPDQSAPRGQNEADNVEIYRRGTLPEFDFEIRDHLAIGEYLDILDFERGGKVSGSGFPLYKGQGAYLERALLNFMIDLHINEHGYTEVFPPFLVNRDSMFGTAQLPKLEQDMYYIEKDELYLIPTAEVPITNMHRDEIVAADDLPYKYVAYSACFRREAGSYGKDTRGFLRVHQFNKIELVNFTLPEQSYLAHEQLLKEATNVLDLLEIPYRVMLLATGDLSFAAAKCYDIETWSPAEEKWLEVSSISNFGEFQARRANIRFRREKGNPLEYVHTLNGSGLATSRLIVSILECYQTDENTVIVPPVLRPYMQGMDIIKKKYK